MPIVSRIQAIRIRGHNPSRVLAIVLLLVAGIASLVLFFSIAFPPVVRDLKQFVTDFPARLPILVAKVERFPLARKVGISSVAGKAQSALAATAGYLFTSLPNWLTHLFDILTATFLCIYFMLEGDEVYRFFLSLFPEQPRIRLHAALQRADTRMSKWLLGQGLLMLILGACSTLVFSVLHVRYAVLLGVLMGLLNIIPIAGGVVTILIAAGVAALDSWTKMAGVLIFYFIYINLENAVLTPRIMKSSVDLMGITVLVALLIGTALAGIVRRPRRRPHRRPHLRSHRGVPRPARPEDLRPPLPRPRSTLTNTCVQSGMLGNRSYSSAILLSLFIAGTLDILGRARLLWSSRRVSRPHPAIHHQRPSRSFRFLGWP